MKEAEIAALAASMLEEHGLTDWRVDIVEDIAHLESAAGFTFQEEKRIEIAREFWPTDERNIHELLRHEIAHALLGHGDHNERWIEKLKSLGGTFTWFRNDGTETHSPEL